MLKNFRSYQLAIRFCHLGSKLRLARHLKDQFDRASASVALNLAEGYGRTSLLDKRKFYVTAMASLRECQAVLDIAQVREEETLKIADHLGACLYKLSRWSP